MNEYDLGEAVLRTAPKQIARAAVLVLAVGLWANAGWATGLVTGLVEHRADAIARSMQEAVAGVLSGAGSVEVPAFSEPTG